MEKKLQLICKVMQKAQTTQLIVCIVSHYHTKRKWLNTTGVAPLLYCGVSLNKRDCFNIKSILGTFLMNTN